MLPLFCLRRSPEHGTVRVVIVLLVVVGIATLYFWIKTQYRETYKNKRVDMNKTISCEKFQLFVTKFFAEISQKHF